MRFYLYQLNGKLGDMQENARKIASFTQNFKNDVCTLLPSLPLIQHPYSAVSRIGGFFERVKRHKLISKNTNIVYESLYKGEKFFWKKTGDITLKNSLIQIGTVKIFAPHCQEPDFACFLKKLAVPKKADLIYFAAAHSFYEGFDIQALLSRFAKKHKKALVYVNACGASDGTVFAGQSMLFDKKGKLLLKLNPFSEDSAYFDFDGSTLQAEPKEIPNINADGLLFLAAKQAIYDYAYKTGIKKPSSG